MNTETRAFATEIVETFLGEEDRAVTVHRVGQLTVGDYRRLDLVDPREINGLARVRTRVCPTAFECIGLADGWLVRAELTDRDVAGLHRHPRIWALFELPYLRLVDERTGFAFPDPRLGPTCTPVRAKVINVPPLDASDAALRREDEQDDQPAADH